MARFRSIALVVALGTTVSGCAAAINYTGEPPNRSVDSINQPIVERTDYVLDLSSQGDGLATSEGARLAGWFDSLGVGYGDRVWVEETYGPTRSRDDVAQIAAEYGLLLSEGAPVTTGTVQPGAVRVIVTRSSAHVPGCPNWTGASGPSTTSSNYGCATNSNLAAMIADPSDLVLGQAGTGAGNGATAAKAIKVYRDTVPTGSKGLTAVSTTGGN